MLLRLSLVTVSRDYSVVVVCQLLIVVASLMCGVWALEHSGINSCGTWAQLPCSLLYLPGPGIKAVSPALSGRFLKIGPSGKSSLYFILFLLLLLLLLSRSDSVRPHRWQPTRLRCPWDSPDKNTGVGCHFLLQCIKVKSESEVAQLCPTLRDPMDCSLPDSSIHGFSRKEYWSGVPLPSPFY